MTVLTRFDTPASVRDMPDGSAFYLNWHNFLSGLIAETTPGPGGIGEFYNPSLVDVDPLGERALNWMALPRRILMPNRDDRCEAFTLTEDRDLQDEYCEWRVTRNSEGKITKIVFVTEAPEYWEELWRVNRARVVELYCDLTGDPTVTEADLHDGSGAYQRRNPWNETAAVTGKDTIVHLIQNINTLYAAVSLAEGSASTALANDNYEVLGLANTSVDPRVALDVGTLVRKGLSVTLRDPIGLYIADWDDAGWTKPNGKPVGDYWEIVRGRPGEVLRLKYEVPAKEGFVVGDIRIGGRPVEYGSQVAEHLTVTIVGTAGKRVSGNATTSGIAKRGNDEEKGERRDERKIAKANTLPQRRGRQSDSLERG